MSIATEHSLPGGAQRANMEFLAQEIQQYAEDHTTAEYPLLRKIARHTRAHVHSPRMLSGHLQGRLLSLFSRMIKPSLVLEIGTYTGYSALCLAEGLSPNGRVVTIDNDVSLAKQTRDFLAESPRGSQIDFRIGDAAVIIPTLTHRFDMVFIDADKVNYSRYYRLAMDKLAPRGYIIADNVLWSGKVLRPPAEQDEKTRALASFSREVQADPRVENILLPVRDGLMIVQKIDT